VTANALSLLRLLLAAPFAWTMSRDGPEAAAWAAVLVAVAIGTDLADGPVARRLGTESARGRALDHTADFATVAAGLFGAASRGAVPWLLPVLVSAAFAQYVIDSLLLHRERRLRMSVLGRWNGILYFFPVCGDILARLGFAFLAAPVRWLAWVLVATTLLSVGDRLLALRPAPRTAPGSPGGGTRDRSPR
jgi:phosphatidylglycerophosphate synthase